MARNSVQFQKGLSDARFEDLYGSEEKCRAALMAWRWPEGFVCPACGSPRHCVIKNRGLWQCHACRTQTSLIAGTIFASTKLPLTVWFRAMFLVTQTKQGISRLELSRRLGVSYDTAWKIHHKLAQAMMERDATQRLEGRVEVDDAYLGGEHNGGKRGRGSPGKLPIVAAVETTAEGKPRRVKIRRVKRFSKRHIEGLARRIVERGTKVVTDGLGCFRGFAAAGCEHVAVITGSGRKVGAPCRLHVGQHHARQHQDGANRHIPACERQTRAALACRVRVPLQPPPRSARADPPPRLGRRAYVAYAIQVAKAG
jgi:ribosomal protein L37AE/L43A